MELYSFFNKDNHLQPPFDKEEFDNLHGWDFGWAILETINIAESKDDDKELSKRFSKGQKALYFFWYLDADVTNGGFIQFYWNDNREYLHAIVDGLKLIGDTTMLDLLEKADNEFLTNKEFFVSQQKTGDWEPLYKSLKNFDTYDQEFYRIHDNTMALIERYARSHQNDFVKFR